MENAKCRHCGEAHDATAVVCPTTGQRMGSAHPAPDDTAISFLGKVIDGRYRLLSIIGQGAMATVYEVENLSIGRAMAIKLLHPKRRFDQVAVKRLQREARLAGSIGHPNICDVYDIGFLEGGAPYLVMERLVGETLETRIARDGYLTLGEATELFTQVLSALIATHAKGIIHRDMSPQNIFIVEREGCAPVPKLLDFGLSRPPQASTEGLTAKGALIGTPKYMAPEQVKGEEVDARADLYGCGAVLYEALTGYPPFFAGNRADLIIEILHGRRRPARSYRPELPVQVDVVLAKAMARDLNARFQDAMAFQRALEKLRHAHVISTAPDIVPSTIGPATAAPVTEPMEETFDDNAIGESIEVVFSSSPETLRERDTAPPSPGASKGEAEEETETKPMPARRGRGRR